MTAPYRLLAPQERVRYWRGYAERAVPAVVTLVLVAAMTVPVFVTVPVIPHLGLLGVLIWANFQPGLMPPWLAFVIGVVADVLFGLPLGVNATLLPVMVIGVRLIGARLVASRFGDHSYISDWLFATLVIGVFTLAEWALLSIAGTSGPFAPLAVQAGTTILAYPAVVGLIARVQRRLQALG